MASYKPEYLNDYGRGAIANSLPVLNIKNFKLTHYQIMSVGEKMGAEKWLVWADKAYFGFAIIAAIATGLTIVAGLAQYRLNAIISAKKDFDLKAYQTTAGVQIAAANREAADAKQTAAQANQQTAQLKAANLALEAAITPRNLLPPSTFTLLFISLQQRPRIMVKSYASDVEGARLAAEIISQLQTLNFPVADSSLTVAAQSPPAFGVYVSGSNKYLNDTLVEWLNESDLQAVIHDPPPSTMTLGGQNFTIGVPDVTIFVGAKPITDFPK